MLWLDFPRKGIGKKVLVDALNREKFRDIDVVTYNGDLLLESGGELIRDTRR